jgi:glycosyltransferase involved in cell wall biosynthesis
MTGTQHRIAHIMPWEGVGGTEHAALRIADAVRAAGFDSTFFCLGAAPVVRAFFASAGYDTAVWRDRYPSFDGYRYFLHDSLQLAREFRRRAITIVHCADVPAGAYAALAGRLALVPVICHVRNRYTEVPELERRFLRPVSKFAFVSRGSWRVFGHTVPARRGTVVYDGIDAPGAVTKGDDAASRAVRQEFDIPAAATIVGMIARVDRQKDYETLAKAAARVVADTRNVRFLIVGGYSVETVQQRHFEQVKMWLAAHGVAQYFIFTDFRSDVARLLQAMDIVILSTHYEGLPLVLLEAMARGKPVVATAVDGIPELITNRETGLLFPHQDDVALATHIRSLIRDPEWAARLGTSGWSSVRANFNNEQFRRGILGMYESILPGHSLSGSIQRSLEPFADLALRAGCAAINANVRAAAVSRSRA